MSLLLVLHLGSKTKRALNPLTNLTKARANPRMESPEPIKFVTMRMGIKNPTAIHLAKKKVKMIVGLRC